MQDTSSERPTRGNFSNFNAKYIQNWDDFRKTFKPAKFEHSLNAATQEELVVFWQPLLTELQAETERICILVPSRVPKPDSLEGVKEEPLKKAGKNAQKQGKNNKPAEVALQQRVIECAMELIRSSFPQLDFDYSSLFLGNDKQLLIYRRCTSIEKYIEKYRLPKTFEGPFEELSKAAKDLYDLRTQRNKAFSTFNIDLIERTQKLAELAQQRLNELLQGFLPLFSSIFADFLGKPKCKQLILHNAAQEVIEALKQVCKGQAEILNRFNQCENDQYRDVIVVKLDDARLRVYDPKDYEERVQYVYVDAVPQNEPPKDIRNLTFLKIDIQKQCYRYRIDLPTSGKHNPLAGVFIRSQQGSESYQINIDIPAEAKQVEVDIYPYKHGKSVYEIYTWNQYGFTKSTEKIVLYNEMPLPSSQAPKLKNRKIYFLGETECGLYPEKTDTADQLIPFSFQGKEHTATNISLGNAAIICDAFGDVAGWGEMYCPPEQESQAEKGEQSYTVEELQVSSLRIDPPCLLLANKQIRKVSCGNGYCLMASTFGAVFSMGSNQFGQLGLGHFNSGEENMNPAEVCKFTDSASSFIVDVQATICGASFAISESGQAFRWGYNQIQDTQFPILDRFDSIINYSTSPLYFKSPHPTAIKKHHISSGIKQIQAGATFFVAVDKEGVMYGWGECKYLGVAQLKDKQENVVIDIVNPIQICKGIQRVAVGFDHCIATTKDGRYLAWGNSAAFSKNIKNFASTPIDVTEEYGGKEKVQMIRAGRFYTAILTTDNTIRLIGQNGTFKQEQYSLNFKVADMACSYENFVGVLGEIS